ENGREADDVVLDDHVWFQLAEDLAQPLVGVAGAVDKLLPNRENEGLELLDRGLAELGRGLADEVLPELAGRLLDLRRRLKPHQRLLEALRLERAGEGFLDDEDDPLAAFQQHPTDSDAVVRRAEGALREEDDRQERACSTSAQSSSGSSSPTL